MRVALLVWPGVKESSVALSDAERLGSDVEAESVMFPFRPRLFSVIVDDLLLPDETVRLVGLGEIVKSLAMIRGSVSFLVMPPPVPVMVRE